MFDLPKLALCLFFVAITNPQEGGGKESSGDGDYAHANDEDEGSKDAPASSDGIDVAIADGGKGADRPPEGFEDRREMLGLSLVFKEIDTGSGKVEYDDGDDAEEDDFFARNNKGAAHTLHGGTVFGQFKDADEAEESECPRGAQVESNDDIKGEHREEVDDAKERKGVVVPGTGQGEAGKVFHCEDQDAAHFKGTQGGASGLTDIGQGLDCKGD